MRPLGALVIGWIGDRHGRKVSLVLTIMLMAAGDVPPTQLPQPIRIVARPILEGQTGEGLMAQEILLTVAAGKKQAGASRQAANSP